MGMKWERQSAEAWPAYGSGTQVNAIGHFVVLDICGMPEPLLNEWTQMCGATTTDGIVSMPEWVEGTDQGCLQMD